MDSQEQEDWVMECGEEDLSESQKTFYSSKQKDLDELIELAQNSRSQRIDDTGAARLTAPVFSISTSTWTPRNVQSVTNAPSNTSLVVLNPSVLNQLVSNSGYVVSSTSNGVVPNVSTVRVPAPTTEAITLSSLLNTAATPLAPPNYLQSRYPAPPRPSHHVQHVPAACAPTAPVQRAPPRYAQHIPAAPSPAAPVPRSRVMLSVYRGSTSGSRIPVQPPSSISSAQSLSFGLPSVDYGLNRGPHTRLPSPPKIPGNPSLNEPTPQNLIAEMSKNFDDPESAPVDDGTSTRNDSNSMEQSPPPSNLPLLPETRPEAASDARPRIRPGPASRTRPIVQTDKPVYSNSASSSPMVDLTHDDQHEDPNSKKAPVKEKTFPSLIVIARPSLKIFSSALVNNERLLMDNQIRKVMQMIPSVFVEYLLQQRLLKSEQFCETHNQPLKLGVYSDPHRFPISGGYVWIADCCKSGLCSVYSGSLFDKTLQPPTNIIKLMYHWACNTAVHNVLNWVKVDSFIMKTYYTFFRAVCTTIVHQKLSLLGGASKKIQVGVISVGTYPEGSTKEVKVDIMAVMDPDVPQIRLKVLENFLSDNNKVYESKFRKILEVLKEWVHPESTIITDFAVDMHLCREYGFSNLEVSGGRHTVNNNNGVMDYMRAKIPDMFQNTLGLLSYTIIQQFLDELVWRETWGPFPSRAYESLVKHIAELTKLPGPDLITKLKKIASEPKKNWKFSVWNEEAKETAKKLKAALHQPVPPSNLENEHSHLKALLKNESAARPLSPAVEVPDGPGKRLSSDRKIFLEAYYYGFIQGDPALQKQTGTFLAECIICQRNFLSASSYTNHLIHHALNSPATMLKAGSSEQLFSVCDVCCKVVQNVASHKEKMHKSTTAFMCKICRLDLITEEKIVKHMCYVHQELEMPYKCDICHYRTSIFDTAINHFKTCHDRDSYLRCPFCLKTVRFTSNSGLDIPSNVYYFVQHVQKHSLYKLNRRCEKCALSFNNMGTLKQHQEKVHIRSGRLLKGVRRLKGEPRRMLVMPFPVQAPLPPVTVNEDSFHTLKGKALSSSVKVPEYYAVCSCLECDAPMTQNHFSVKMTCTKCSFQSCCPNAIREHSARRHQIADSPTDIVRSQIMGGRARLDRNLYCSYCTYWTMNGNKMATHMANCGDGAAVATPYKRKRADFMPPIQIKHERV